MHNDRAICDFKAGNRGVELRYSDELEGANPGVWQDKLDLLALQLVVFLYTLVDVAGWVGVHFCLLTPTCYWSFYSCYKYSINQPLRFFLVHRDIDLDIHGEGDASVEGRAITVMEQAYVDIKGHYSGRWGLGMAVLPNYSVNVTRHGGLLHPGEAPVDGRQGTAVGEKGASAPPIAEMAPTTTTPTHTTTTTSGDKYDGYDGDDGDDKSVSAPPLHTLEGAFAAPQSSLAVVRVHDENTVEVTASVQRALMGPSSACWYFISDALSYYCCCCDNTITTSEWKEGEMETERILANHRARTHLQQVECTTRAYPPLSHCSPSVLWYLITVLLLYLP